MSTAQVMDGMRMASSIREFDGVCVGVTVVQSEGDERLHSKVKNAGALVVCVSLHVGAHTKRAGKPHAVHRGYHCARVYRARFIVYNPVVDDNTISDASLPCQGAFLPPGSIRQAKAESQSMSSELNGRDIDTDR